MFFTPNNQEISQFQICSGHWIESLKTHLYRVSCTQVFFWLECVNIIIYFRSTLTLYKWVFIASFQRSQQIRKWTVFQIFYLWQDLIWWLCNIIIINFLSSQKASFLSRTSLVLFTQKQRNKKVQSFNQKHGLTPFWEKTKMNVATMKNQYFCCIKGLLFYQNILKCWKIFAPCQCSPLILAQQVQCKRPFKAKNLHQRCNFLGGKG